MRSRVTWILLAVPLIAHAGFNNNGRGCRPISLANAYVAMADDPWAVIYNPAGLARILDVRVAAFVSPDQFGMTELRTISAGGVIPFSVCTGGVLIDQFGYDLYKETVASIAFGRSLNEMISIGVTIHCARFAIEHYGTETVWLCDAGGIASVTEDVRVGYCWKNITQTTIGAHSEQLPQIMSMGVSFEINEHSRLTLELEKDIRYPFIKKFGYEQQFFDILSVRLGVSDNPDKFAMGFGVRVGGIDFSYAGYSHPQLGWTHQVEMSFTFMP